MKAGDTPSRFDGAFQPGAAAFAFRYLETLPLRIIFDDLQGRFASYPMGTSSDRCGHS